MSDLELLEQYREYLITVKNASSNTENSYMRDLRQLQAYLSAEIVICLPDADEPSLSNYLSFLRNAGKSASTLSRNIASWKNFYQFLLQKNIVEENRNELIRAQNEAEIMESKKVKYCMECGRKLAFDARYCDWCGTKAYQR